MPTSPARRAAGTSKNGVPAASEAESKKLRRSLPSSLRATTPVPLVRAARLKWSPVAANGWLGVPGYFQFPIVYGTFVDSTRWDPDFDVIWGAPIGLADMQGGMPVVRKPDGSLMRGTAGSGAAS